VLFKRDNRLVQAYLQYSAVRSLTTVISKHFKYSKVKVYKHVFVCGPVRPKARRLVQHGGPPGWLEESDPAGVILYVMDGPHRLPFPYCFRMP
jgi:hypothetical protein